jgi:hypothetical protein
VAGLALLLSGLVAFPTPALASTQAAALSPGQELRVGQQLVDGPFFLVMQRDGNLVEYVTEPNGHWYAMCGLQEP